MVNHGNNRAEDKENKLENKGTPKLSPLETRTASILGETSVCGIVSETEGDTDVADETTDEPGKTPFYILCVKN